MKAVREWSHSISPKTTMPHNQTRTEEKEKTVEDKKMGEQLGQHEGIDPALKTHQSNTVKHKVIEIVS